MSFRPRFPNANNAFPSFNVNSQLENVRQIPQSNINAFQENAQNNYRNVAFTNSSNLNIYPSSTTSALGITTNVIGTTSLYSNAQFHTPPFNVRPFSHPNSINTQPNNIVNLTSQPLSVNPSFDQITGQSSNRFTPPIDTNSNVNFNVDTRNIHRFPPPLPNATYNSLPPNVNFPRFQNNTCLNNPVNIPVSLTGFSQFSVPVIENRNITNSSANYSVANLNNPIPQSAIYTSPLPINCTMMNSSQDSLIKLQNSSTGQIPPQFIQSDALKPHNMNYILDPVVHDKQKKLTNFIAKFSLKKKENKSQVTIPEFRYVIKAAIRMIKILNERKDNLSKLLDASESEWKLEVENVLNEKEELSTLCSFINAPDHLNSMIEKLKLIKKRRERKKKTKQNKLSEKLRAEQKRKERHQEIDKWLDDIKEKNQKIKREAELKKEADFILLEVRRKIYEAKKTIEKIKVFEKLRYARQANATQKGLHVLTMHNVKFEKKMSFLKETMMRQLADYEAEEKALKVMLETEQEGQREEETQWKIKKLKTLQHKRQNHIVDCLFGNSEDPLPTDPLFLFHKYHTSSSSSIENLVQIRQQWDMHISEDGEVIPQQWVVPVAPSDASWEQCLITSKN